MGGIETTESATIIGEGLDLVSPGKNLTIARTMVVLLAETTESDPVPLEEPTWSPIGEAEGIDEDEISSNSLSFARSRSKTILYFQQNARLDNPWTLVVITVESMEDDAGVAKKVKTSRRHSRRKRRQEQLLKIFFVGVVRTSTRKSKKDSFASHEEKYHTLSS